MNEMAMRGARRLEERAVALLKPQARNARTHSPAQLKKLEASIRQFGFVNPVLVDEEDRILVCHGRVAAAKAMGIETVPVVYVSGMTEAERKAYVIADNRLADLAGWDDELLRLELGAIEDLDLGFDLELTGFATAEIEKLLGSLDNPPDETPAPEPVLDKPPVTLPGMTWQLGRHRLTCGDARDPAVLEQLMGGELAQLVFTDPPYDVRVDGHVCGLGKVKHAEFAMASGEMSAGEFTAFLETVLGNLAAASVDGSIHFVCMDWRHMRELQAAGDAVYDELKNLVVWNKDNGGMGTFYRSKHELIYAFKKGKAPHVNNFELGQHGRYRTNVWDYPGVNSMSATRASELAMHPTVKPVALVADSIRDRSSRGAIVLDGFSGSGTTIMAAELTGRRGYAVEIDPRYVDVAVRRWQEQSGEAAIDQLTGMTFDELANAG